MDVPLGIVYFLLNARAAQLSQAAADGGEGRDFSLLPIIAPSY